MNKILITGGSGLLGKEILKINPEILAPNHSEFDITNYNQMFDYISSLNIDVINLILLMKNTLILIFSTNSFKE